MRETCSLVLWIFLSSHLSVCRVPGFQSVLYTDCLFCQTESVNQSVSPTINRPVGLLLDTDCLSFAVRVLYPSLLPRALEILTLAFPFDRLPRKWVLIGYPSRQDGGIYVACFVPFFCPFSKSLIDQFFSVKISGNWPSPNFYILMGSCKNEKQRKRSRLSNNIFCCSQVKLCYTWTRDRNRIVPWYWKLSFGTSVKIRTILT